MYGTRKIAIAAIAVVQLLFIGGSSVPCAAQGSCSEGCRAAFASCYRSTSNRSACEAQLQRCLQGCVATRGG